MGAPSSTEDWNVVICVQAGTMKRLSAVKAGNCIMLAAALVVLLVFIRSNCSLGSAYGTFRNGEYVSADGHRMKFVVCATQDQEPSAGYPLIVYLHRLESLGYDGMQQLNNPLAFNIYCQVGRTAWVPCVALFPQSTSPWSTSGRERQYVCELIDEIVRSYNVDHTRVLLVGEGDGARGAAKLAVEHPNRCKGLVLFSSAGSPPFDGRFPSDFSIKWYDESPVLSDSRLRPDVAALEDRYAGKIQWVGWMDVALKDCWSMPGFSDWIKTKENSR